MLPPMNTSCVPADCFAQKSEFHAIKVAFFQLLILRLLPSVRMSSVDSYRIKRVQFFGRKVRLLKILEVVGFAMFAINQQPAGLFSTRTLTSVFRPRTLF